MAYTQDDADKLRRAIARGARKVQMGSESVEFNSPSEMRKTLADIEASLRGGSTKAFRSITPLLDRGL